MSQADRFFEDDSDDQVAESASRSGQPTLEEMAGLARAHPGPDEAWAAYRREAAGLPFWRVPPLAWTLIGAALLLYGLLRISNLMFFPETVIQDESLFHPTLVAAAAAPLLAGVVVSVLGIRAFVRRRRFFLAFARAAKAVSAEG